MKRSDVKVGEVYRVTRQTRRPKASVESGDMTVEVVSKDPGDTYQNANYETNRGVRVRVLEWHDFQADCEAEGEAVGEGRIEGKRQVHFPATAGTRYKPAGDTEEEYKARRQEQLGKRSFWSSRMLPWKDLADWVSVGDEIVVPAMQIIDTPIGVAHQEALVINRRHQQREAQRQIADETQRQYDRAKELGIEEALFHVYGNGDVSPKRVGPAEVLRLVEQALEGVAGE